MFTQGKSYRLIDGKTIMFCENVVNEVAFLSFVQDSGRSDACVARWSSDWMEVPPAPKVTREECIVYLYDGHLYSRPISKWSFYDERNYTKVSRVLKTHVEDQGLTIEVLEYYPTKK